MHAKWKILNIFQNSRSNRRPKFMSNRQNMFATKRPSSQYAWMCLEEWEWVSVLQNRIECTCMHCFPWMCLLDLLLNYDKTITQTLFIVCEHEASERILGVCFTLHHKQTLLKLSFETFSKYISICTNESE